MFRLDGDSWSSSPAVRNHSFSYFLKQPNTKAPGLQSHTGGRGSKTPQRRRSCSVLALASGSLNINKCALELWEL